MGRFRQLLRPRDFVATPFDVLTLPLDTRRCLSPISATNLLSTSTPRFLNALERSACTDSSIEASVDTVRETLISFLAPSSLQQCWSTAETAFQPQSGGVIDVTPPAAAHCHMFSEECIRSNARGTRRYLPNRHTCDLEPLMLSVALTHVAGREPAY